MWGKCAAPRDRHEAAAGDRAVRRDAVLDRDRAVAFAPGDQRRHVAQEVEAVGGADALAVAVDDRAQRLHERLALAGALERPQCPRDGLQLRADPRAALAQRDPGTVQVARHEAMRRERDQGARAWERGAAQQRADLVAQAAARHQSAGARRARGTARSRPSRPRRRASGRPSSRVRCPAPTGGRGSPRRARRASSRRAAWRSRRARSGPARSRDDARRAVRPPRPSGATRSPCRGPAPQADHRRRCGRPPGGRGARSPRRRTRGAQNPRR